ncbi:MAG TPA: Rrf2 family transcriptional regulator [Pirellulales bacterium]|nr:Rrf2 family transcriptional regulator [Pirellulales bacterium]
MAFRVEADMKLTGSVSYAVGLLLQIEKLGGNGPITAAKIARGCHFPPRFLYRVLRRLVDAGLLRGTSGPGGGYALARSPRSITLLDIVAGVESPPKPSVLSPVCAKQREAIALINRVCLQDARRFAAELSQINLAQLGRLTARRRRRGGRSKS